MTALRIVETTPNHALGYAPGLVLYIWRGTTSLEGVRGLISTARKGHEHAEGRPIGMLGLVTDDAPPPSSEVRRAIADMLAGAKFLSASAVTFETGGFQGAMVRAVATGLNLLAKPPYPHKVFPSVYDASLWLHEQLVALDSETRPSTQIEELLHELRSAPHTG